MAIRWETANEYTTYSAIYCDGFGEAIAFSSLIESQKDEDTFDIDSEVSLFVSELAKRVPSVEEAIKCAQEHSCLSVELNSFCKGRLSEHTADPFMLNSKVFA